MYLPTNKTTYFCHTAILLFNLERVQKDYVKREKESND